MRGPTVGGDDDPINSIGQRPAHDHVDEADDQGQMSEIEQQAHDQIELALDERDARQRLQKIDLNEIERRGDGAEQIAVEDALVREARPAIAPPERAMREDVLQPTDDAVVKLERLDQRLAARILCDVRIRPVQEHRHRQRAEHVEHDQLLRVDAPK